MDRILFIVVLFYGYSILCCDEGYRQLIKGTVCQYTECISGEWVRKDCHSHFSTDGYITECDDITFRTFIPNSKEYHRCNYESFLLKSCHENEFIDFERKQCGKISSIKSNNVIVSEYTKGPKRETDGRCTDGSKRKKEGSCKQYYECKGGIEVVMRCLECENYDEEEKRCRYVFNSPCHKASPFPEPGTTTFGPTDTSLSSPQPTPPETNPAPWAVTSTEAVGPNKNDIGTTDHTPSAYPSPFMESSTFDSPPVTTTPPEGTTGRLDISSTQTSRPRNQPSSETTQNEKFSSTEEPTTEMTPSNTTEPMATEVPEAEPPSDCAVRTERISLPDCKYYLECSQGELLTRKCGWFQYFDSESYKCSYIGYKCHEKNDAIRLIN